MIMALTPNRLIHAGESAKTESGLTNAQLRERERERGRRERREGERNRERCRESWRETEME